MMLRNLLWTRLERAEADEFETEALGLDLLDMSLKSVRTDGPAASIVRAGAAETGAGTRQGSGSAGAGAEMERRQACRDR